MEILKFHKTRQGYFIEHKNEYHFLFFFSFSKYFTDKFHLLKRIKINSSCCLNRFNHKGGREGKTEGLCSIMANYLRSKEKKGKRKKNIIIVLGIISRPRSRLTPVIELESER